MIRLFVLVVWVISPFVAAQQDLPWSRFRGPNGKGIAESGRLPDKIGPNENVIWKKSLPRGHSSPALTRTHIFLTAFEGEKLETMCLERSTGSIVWRKSVSRARKSKFHRANNGASPTPAVDADTVVVFFPEFGRRSHYEC